MTNIYGLIFFDYSLSAFLTIGLLQIFATFVSLTLVDFLGRKTLLVISGSGMVVCLAALVILSNIWDIEEIFMTSLGLLFIMSSSLGWGPIPWVMMSELVYTTSGQRSSQCCCDLCELVAGIFFDCNHLQQLPSCEQVCLEYFFHCNNAL